MSLKKKLFHVSCLHNSTTFISVHNKRTLITIYWETELNLLSRDLVYGFIRQSL